MKLTLRMQVLARDGFRCRYCGATPFQTELHADHVIPSTKKAPRDVLPEEAEISRDTDDSRHSWTASRCLHRRPFALQRKR